jgi:hypothetical protein
MGFESVIPHVSKALSLSISLPFPYASLLFTLPVVVDQFKWKIFEFATLCKGRAFRNSGWQIMIQ